MVLRQLFGLRATGLSHWFRLLFEGPCQDKAMKTMSLLAEPPHPPSAVVLAPLFWVTGLLLTYPRALLPLCPLSQVHLQPQDMSCYNQCLPCQPCGPTPLASSCNEPCVRQCQNSTVVIEPSPVVVTLPGPILSSFPQNTVVGSSTSAAVGSILSCDGVPITSGCCDLSGISSRYCGRRCLPC
ncbi:feather keratin Cos2-3-like [Anser cygnoides]|uniref:feather keratin Cos2-3-like n=1 Tax=Anser cygnoides TaxID=8845 RepID=UPI0034D2AD05